MVPKTFNVQLSTFNFQRRAPPHPTRAPRSPLTRKAALPAHHSPLTPRHSPLATRHSSPLPLFQIHPSPIFGAAHDAGAGSPGESCFVDVFSQLRVALIAVVDQQIKSK